MQNKINLTAPMRSNLIALQQTTKLQSKVQQHLSTGLKVNSAIENPSSYYTAKSLGNQAKDLSSLLDSLHMGIQTIKAAQNALDLGLNFLTQAQALGNTAIENAGEPQDVSKEWLIANGVKAADIVTNKTELLSRLNTANTGDTIVIFGNIEMGDDTIALKEGVSLVGAQKIINDLGAQDEFQAPAETMKISFYRSTSSIGITAQNNCLISDLDIDFTTAQKNDDGGAVYVKDSSGVVIRNININYNAQSGSTLIGAIYTHKSDTKFEGNININTTGAGSTAGIVSQNYAGLSTFTVAADAVITISTDNEWGAGLQNGYWDIKGTVNISTSGDNARAIYNLKNTTISGSINITAPSGTNANFYITDATFTSTATLSVTATNRDASNNLQIPAGMKIYFSDIDKTLQSTIANTLTVFNYTNMLASPNYTDVSLLRTMNAGNTAENSRTQTNADLSSYKIVPKQYYRQYIGIIDQFNTLIKDANYKGNNLLASNDLLIKFNPSGSSSTTIKGIDVSSSGLGLKNNKWSTVTSVNETLEQLREAIDTIRQYSAELGNNYSIITTRKNFNENLINILNEGADKLTLADMNEESANMLALQTRQQLATNALSLAGEASRSVISLF